jgi:hypothetical protein
MRIQRMRKMTNDSDDNTEAYPNEVLTENDDGEPAVTAVPKKRKKTDRFKTADVRVFTQEQSAELDRRFKALEKRLSAKRPTLLELIFPPKKKKR